MGYKSDTATPANSRLFFVHYGGNQDTGGINLTNSGNLLIGTSTSPATYGKLVVAGGMTTSDDVSGKLVVGRYSAGVPNSYIKLGALSTSLRITNAADSADLVTILNTGDVSISSSTAGSAGVGALVVTGGLAAGNNGNASYFGGAVTAAVVTSTGAGYTNSGFQITNTSASRTTGLFLSNAGVTSIRDVTGAADLFTLSLTGAATFAGAVEITGATTLNNDVYQTALKKFYVDSGSNTYFHENSADSFQIVTGGTIAFTLGAGSALFNGIVIGPATTANYASIRLPHGTTAPTSPVNGDMWSTTAGLFIRINGVTKTVTLT